MDDQILYEIKEVRKLLSKLIGSSDLPASQQFSREALDKVAEEFKKLSIERGNWVKEHEIYKVIKDAPNYCGRFIIERFGFSNYFKRGQTNYYYRKDLLALNRELKARNINLRRYEELINDQDKFRKYVETVPAGKKKGKRYHIPEGLKDIQKTSSPPPSVEVINKHIASLKEEFEKDKLSDYIDLYEKETHALLKIEYYFEKYIDPQKKKHCRKWCDDFNYANNALKEARKIKQ
jgi:hypothetical protein